MHHSFLPQPQPAPLAVRGLLPLPAGTAYAEGEKAAISDPASPAGVPPDGSKGPLWPQRIALAFPGGKARRRRTGRFSAFGAALMLGCVGAMGVSPGADARSTAGIAAERNGRPPAPAVECRLHQAPGAEALSGCMLAQASSRKLNRAVKKGNLKAVKSLVAAGADVNNKDRNGWTPLHLAAKRGYLEIVKALVAGGADLSMSNTLTKTVNDGNDKKGATPLNLAISYGHEQIIKFLINAGADVNAQDKGVWTPLHDAARFNSSPEVISLLINAGADANARKEDGWTPLHLLSVNDNSNRHELAQILIDAGADVDAMNNDLKTPLYWAARKGRNKLITTLIDAGADTAAINEAKRDIERERREREERERREREERERREREERERQERWSEWQEQQEREALERREREVRELELDLRERRAREELDSHGGERTFENYNNCIAAARIAASKIPWVSFNDMKEICDEYKPW